VRKLAELLRSNQLKPVDHGDHGLRTLKELARSYLTMNKDVTGVMNSLKALYCSWGIVSTGTEAYARHHRPVGSARSATRASDDTPNTRRENAHIRTAQLLNTAAHAAKNAGTPGRGWLTSEAQTNPHGELLTIWRGS
jgi:hypothetical protein